jgi:hypothetical protein
VATGIVAPTGLLRSTVKVSGFSSTLSPATATTTAADVRPGPKESVPEAAA